MLLYQVTTLSKDFMPKLKVPILTRTINYACFLFPWVVLLFKAKALCQFPRINLEFFGLFAHSSYQWALIKFLFIPPKTSICFSFLKDWHILIRMSLYEKVMKLKTWNFHFEYRNGPVSELGIPNHMNKTEANSGISHRLLTCLLWNWSNG